MLAVRCSLGVLFVPYGNISECATYLILIAAGSLRENGPRHHTTARS